MNDHKQGAEPRSLDELGMDGKLWAEEFHATAKRLGYPEMDEGWLIGWFCNAIMAGFDEARRRYEPAHKAALNEPTNPLALRDRLARECYAVGEFDEVYDPARHDESWNEDHESETFRHRYHDQYLQLADRILALTTQEAAPKLNIRCETSDGVVHGSTWLNVVRVEQEDDGSWTAITDHWPQGAAPSQQEPTREP